MLNLFLIHPKAHLISIKRPTNLQDNFLQVSTNLFKNLFEYQNLITGYTFLKN